MKQFKNKIIKTFIDFINEAYVDKDGNLQDMNYEPNSDDLWNDDEFISFVNDNLEHDGEMPEEFYINLSDNHKKLYRKELLNFGGQMIGYSENEPLLKDLVKYDYTRLEKEMLDWIDMYSTFGNDHFPIEKLFIKNIDEIFQGRIINKLIELMNWVIYIDDEQFNSFHPRVKKLIEDNEHITFILEFD